MNIQLSYHKFQLFFLILLSALSTQLWGQRSRNFNTAQQARLCLQYYNSGEFEKAAECFKEIHEADRGNDYYYQRYRDCLIELQDYKTAEKMVKKAIRHSPDKVERYVDYGILAEKQGDQEKANEQYEKSIKLMPASQMQIPRLANTFIKHKKYDYAIQTYERGEKLLKEKHLYAYDMGNVHRVSGDAEKMVVAYLDALDYSPTRMTNIQAFLQRYLPKMAGDYEVLKTELYRRNQKNPNNSLYPELLIWVYLQESDFESALLEAKALDKRLNENGSRIYKLAQTAENEKAYESAIQAFEYIIDEKGPTCIYYVDAKQSLLAAKRARLTAGYAYTKEEVKQLEKEYEDFLNEFGKTRRNSGIMQELADLEALFLNDLDKAISIMEDVIEIPMMKREDLANAKIKLGDFYLMKGEVWDASLLYSQVDKEMKDAPLGEMARYKNAKLSYYKGDFEWAQDQLDVLKGSTSELISNDAIDVSVFIMEHYNLDTTANSMRLFAEADLLIFQNRFEEAFTRMDSIKILYKDHGLIDDIHFAKAKVYIQKRQFSTALEELNEIVENHKEGILVDNALFQMAEIYEEQMEDPEKAMSLYEQILMEHMGSTFTVEARKRFRRLRGDGV
jgi:tetratricopeptide (TPR) repeat protein